MPPIRKRTTIFSMQHPAAFFMQRFLLLLISCAALTGLAAPAAAATELRRPVVVAYVPNWIELGKFAETIEYGRLTHLNIAFENPVNEDGNLSFNEEDAILIEKARFHGLKVLVSIGGGSASGDK